MFRIHGCLCVVVQSVECYLDDFLSQKREEKRCMVGRLEMDLHEPAGRAAVGAGLGQEEVGPDTIAKGGIILSMQRS